MDAAEQVIKKGHHKVLPAKLVDFLKVFTQEKLEEWDGEKCLKLVKETSSTEKKMLLNSLKNFFASPDQRITKNLKRKFQKLQKKSLKVESNLQQSAIEVLPNCGEVFLTKIETDLDSRYPDADKWRDELIELFGGQLLNPTDIEILLANKTESDLAVLFDALYKATNLKTAHQYMKKKEIIKHFRTSHETRQQLKRFLEKKVKEMFKGILESQHLLVKMTDQGDLNAIVEGITNDTITYELLRKVANVSKRGEKRKDEKEFMEKWEMYDDAHEKLKKNAILLLSSCNLELYGALIKKLDDAITLRGRSLKTFQDLFAKQDVITRDSVRMLLSEADEKDDFYEVLNGVLRQLPSGDLTAAQLFLDTMQDLKMVDLELSKILLSCKNSCLDKFIEELKKHVICKAITDASLTTGDLIQAIKNQNAKTVEQIDLGDMQQLVFTRNRVVHSLVQFTSHEQKESFTKRLRRIARQTKQIKVHRESFYEKF